MLKVALFKSDNRFDSFQAKIKEYQLDCQVFDFRDIAWLEADFDSFDIVIYFPTFNFSSNHPLALSAVYDQFMFLKNQYPHLIMFPDPNVVHYYNDKHRQYLFLEKNGFPIPPTLPLYSEKMVAGAARKIGFPMVLKNRYGAGGDFVFKVNNESELREFYRLSKLDLYSLSALKFFLKKLTRREFYYSLIKAREVDYPFFSFPVLAQKFISMERDLKTVIGDYQIVEGHWRQQVDEKMWKVNIDGGGIGEWSYIDREAIELSEKLARRLCARWLNIDLVVSEGKFLITEFSPVWHHYKYKEKPSFVYKDDYNIDMPLEKSLDLEAIILDSLIKACGDKKVNL